MSLWIKICGNTSLADARVAAAVGADALGFVFAPSPRRVTPEQAAEIIRGLPAEIEKIGVFVDVSLNEIAATVETAGLTGVQLHWNAPVELTAKLRGRFGAGLRILRVVHFGGTGTRSNFTVDPSADAVLVDSRVAGAAGGTGKSYDWAEARRSLFGVAEGIKFIAAGGLAPENVAEAIRTLRPWGVDAVSGVEAAPGRKDAAKVRAFIERARAAER
jgi:phosphoribosylanthranilate isomerase